MDEESNSAEVPERFPGGIEHRLSDVLEGFLRGGLAGPDMPPPGPGVTSDSGIGGQDRRIASGVESPCPEPQEWALLLSEEPVAVDAFKVNRLLAHAGECSRCAQRLRAFSADLKPEETDALFESVSGSAEGRRQLAARLAATPIRPVFPPQSRAGEGPVASIPDSRSPVAVIPIAGGRARKPSSRTYLWVGAALAASVLIAAGVAVWWRAASNPQRLLAEAYTSSRIFDLRMPGAGFAPVTPVMHLRGSSSGHEPATLVEARKQIDSRLAANPADPKWLQLEARSDILEEKFDPAIDILERLMATGPVTASLLLDDASAYFQRGEATGSDSDRATALGYLRHADELAPGDPVVLFNEAVAMEDRGQLINAVEIWNRYLRFERDPKWLDEGRRHLDAVEQNLNEMKKH